MRNDKYKIVYCTPALYSAGGTERVVSVKANYFADVLGYDVTIIVTEGKNGNSFFPLSNNVKVINLGLNFEELWNKSFVKKILLYLRKQKRYKKLLTNELLRIRPDITITTLRREINFINSIDDGSKKIGEQHLSRSNYRRIDSRFSKYYEKLFFWWWKDRVVASLEKLGKLVVLTDDAVSEWPELTNIRMIPDPLSLKNNSFSSLTSKRVITIGRYSYEKGYDILLSIWSIVEKQCTDWQLDIFGEGRLEEEINNNIRKKDLRNVNIHPFTDTISQEYASSSICVLASRFEGFSLVLIEAMRHGLPCVSFNCPYGPKDLIDDNESGYVIENDNIKQFAEKLNYLIENTEIRKKFAKKALLKSTRYDVDTIMSQWRDLFDSLLSNKESR